MFYICNMKKILFLSVALLAVLACNFVVAAPGKHIKGNGVKVEKSFDTAPFDAVRLNGSFDVVFTQGPQKVVLSADENLIDVFKVEVRDGALCLGIERGTGFSTRNKVVFTVSSPELNVVKVNGSGDFKVRKVLDSDALSLSINGSGDIEADKVECKNLTCNINGSGDIEVEALTAASADVKINGSGDVTLVCREVREVTATVNGSGDVDLYGNIVSVSSKVRGSGEVKTHKGVFPTDD